MRALLMIIVGLVVLAAVGPMLIAIAHAMLPIAALVVVALVILAAMRYFWHHTYRW